MFVNLTVFLNREYVIEGFKYVKNENLEKEDSLSINLTEKSLDIKNYP